MGRRAGAMLVASLMGSLLCAGVARAQGGTVTLRGVAYDSVRHEVLPDAFVTLAGVRSATTDSRGRFEFDSVAPGRYFLELQHARLDSMGLPGLSLPTVVTDGRERVTIAIPSFATLWRAACGVRPAPADSGFVYGSVRDVRTGAALPDAAVELLWVDLSAVAVDSRLRMNQRLLRHQTRTDANGEFSACGVPLEAGLRLVAARDSLISGTIDLPASSLPVRRQDLAVGTADRADSASLGDVSGLVTATDGAPVEGARVIVDDVPRGLTGADGRFFVRGVLSGTRQMELLAIGRRPHVASLDIEPGHATELRVTMDRLTTLDVVRVIGSPFQQRLVEEFADHKRLGFGSFLDSSQVGRRGTIQSVFSALPSVELTRERFGGFQIALPYRKGGKCQATIWIDGRRSDTEMLRSIRPDQIAVVEVFPREFNVPWRYQSPGSDCGAAVVWTKMAIY